MPSISDCLLTRVLAGIACASLAGHAAQGRDSSCHRSKELVGDCFTVRGRLNLTNGTPNVRIWKIGTHRILGVVSANGAAEGDGVIPSNVKELIWPAADESPIDASVYGSYRVCPLSREHTGAMQTVCIDKASRLQVTGGKP